MLIHDNGYRKWRRERQLRQNATGRLRGIFSTSDIDLNFLPVPVGVLTRTIRSPLAK